MLSVRQPWAWALVNGHKDVESRTWPTSHRGLVAIHAAQKSESDGFRALERMGIEVPDDLPSGAIVGAVELLDVVEHHPSPWASPERFNWVIGQAFVVGPFPMRGHLGLFGAPAGIAEALLEALGDP